MTYHAQILFISSLSCPELRGMVLELHVGDKAAKPGSTVRACVWNHQDNSHMHFLLCENTKLWLANPAL